MVRRSYAIIFSSCSVAQLMTTFPFNSPNAGCCEPDGRRRNTILFSLALLLLRSVRTTDESERHTAQQAVWRTASMHAHTHTTSKHASYYVRVIFLLTHQQREKRIPSTVCFILPACCRTVSLPCRASGQPLSRLIQGMLAKKTIAVL